MSASSTVSAFSTHFCCNLLHHLTLLLPCRGTYDARNLNRNKTCRRVPDGCENFSLVQVIVLPFIQFSWWSGHWLSELSGLAGWDGIGISITKFPQFGLGLCPPLPSGFARPLTSLRVSSHLPLVRTKQHVISHHPSPSLSRPVPATEWQAWVSLNSQHSTSIRLTSLALVSPSSPSRRSRISCHWERKYLHWHRLHNWSMSEDHTSGVFAVCVPFSGFSDLRWVLYRRRVPFHQRSIEVHLHAG